MALEAIKYKNGQLKILDQLLLPSQTKYIDVNSVKDGWEVINKMQVRGAPAIAIVGCLSLAVELLCKQYATKDDMLHDIIDKLRYLTTARPTAVNMKTAAENLCIGANFLKDQSADVEEFKKLFVEDVEKMLAKDISDNKAIGDHGAKEILLQYPPNRMVRVLTHCNTGSLATAGYGTALGVIRSLHQLKRLEHVYCTETRPYNQGARLTAYELVHDQLPATLICDDMVAALMKSENIAAVVVGADRVVANGDTANKIGTYQIAVLANYHKIPFYVAAPFTSIDMDIATGDGIEIEERPEKEMACIGDKRIAAEGISCWNPAFDVTPASLITGIITERRVFRPNQLKDALHS